jgi:hypothetical protein
MLVPNIKDVKRLQFLDIQWILVIEKEVRFIHSYPTAITDIPSGNLPHLSNE